VAAVLVQLEWQDGHPEIGRAIPYVSLRLSTTAQSMHHAGLRGLDVHKNTIAASVAEEGKRGEMREHGKIARGEYQGWRPGVVRGSARQVSRASSGNHTVRLPRRRRLASYSRQFMTLCFCLGMWRRS